MSAVLEGHLGDYLRLRHIMGHRLAGHEQLIHAFLVEHGDSGGTTVTVEAALAWATAPTERRRAATRRA